MKMGTMLDWKWAFSTKYPLLANPSARPYAPSVRGREASYEAARMSTLSVITEEGETMFKDTSKSYTGSIGALHIIESGIKEMEEMKISTRKQLQSSFDNPDDNIRMHTQDYTSTSYSILPVNKKSRFGLLMENLEKIEESFVNEETVRLETDIMKHLGKLGALELFHACLSHSLGTTLCMSTHLKNLPRGFLVDDEKNDQVGNKIVHSRRKEERKLRREKALKKTAKVSVQFSSPKVNSKLSRWGTGSAAKNASNSRIRRLVISRSESEMCRGAKDVANLERVRVALEKESGCTASFRSWAEAAGLNEKVLQQRLHFGCCCRDDLLRSTKSLVLYLARNYRGWGISLEDLVQAGNIGVLNGAERFDQTRGYKFSTYVQYWIKKSMSDFVTQHSREIQLPVGLSRVINRIQKARRDLYYIHGRYPDDNEIASFTGLSVAKVAAASKCPRVVGSIYQKIGDSSSGKFMEFTADTTIETPEEIVLQRHMRKDIYELLQGLHPRERQVLTLRHGFWDGQSKSLGEIATLCRCTKEWISKIEKSAFRKLRKEQVPRNLSQYLIL